MGKQRIMIVEDDSVTAHFIKRILEGFGYSVLPVISSGENAVSKAAILSPDAVLMDILLSGDMDGIEAAEKLGFLDVPIIYLTSQTELDTLNRASKTTPYGFILKPVNEKNVYITVLNAIQRHELEKKLKQEDEGFKGLFENAPLSYVSIDQRANIMNVNRAFMEITGYAQEQLAGRWFGNFLTSDSIEEFNRTMETIISKGFVSGSGIRLLKKNGSVLPAYFSARASYDFGDSFSQAQCILMTPGEERSHDSSLRIQRDLAMELASVKSLDAAFKLIVDSLVTLEDIDCGGIYLYSDDEGLDLVYHTGLSKKFIHDVFHFNPDSKSMWLVGSGKPFFVKHGDPSMSMPAYRDEGLMSLAVIPIMHDGVLLAVLNCGSHAADEIREGSRYILESTGVQMGEILSRLKAEKENTAAQKALLESEEKFRNLMDFLPAVSIIGYRPGGGIIYWNRASEDMFGYGRDEAEGRNIGELIVPENMRDAYSKCLVSGSEFKGSGEFMPAGDMSLKGRNGDAVPVHTIHMKIGTLDKEPTLFCINIDQRERKASEELLMKNLSLLQKLIETIPIPIFYKDAGDRYIGCNDAFSRIVGIEKKGIVGKTVFDIVPKKLADFYSQSDAELKKTGQKLVFESKFIDRDGKKHQVIFNKAPIYKPDGAYDGIIGAMQDITDLKLAHEALSESEERYRRLVETSPFGIAITALPERTLSYINPAGVKILGYGSADEMIGKKPDHFLPEEVKPGYYKRIREYLDDGSPHPLEERLVKPDGEEIFVETRPIQIEYMGKSSVMITFIDITSRKKIEDIIKASLKEKEVLLREIHHRVKNNMQIISSLINLQARLITDEKIRHEIYEIRERVSSMALIHELLYQTDNFTSINFNKYLNTMIINLFRGYEIDQSRIKIEINIDENLTLPMEKAIPAGLIFNELITNSLKYAFEKTGTGTISIGLKKNGVELYLFVRDDGSGLPEDFENRRKETLGFELVEILTKQIKGRLEIKKGGGTEVGIYFPE
ncbi:MAG: PAS domain S-box protein [Spirochaetes bacterium]|nr:PAS domain S-box protein [Spirochaetota bacterium]